MTDLFIANDEDIYENSDIDQLQDIARAGFGDMLHDTERNQKYYQGIKLAIDKIHRLGQKAYVLDIGTGTGLLSMMSVRSGADYVTAIEGFTPIADCASKIIERNGMKDKIKIIKKRSTEVNFEELFPVPNQRANILVTEVFDTDLIGEAAIQTYQHAHKYLLTKDCLTVPSSAVIYVQIIESPIVNNWNKPKLLPNLDGDILLRTPPEIADSPGSLTSHDIQLSQLPITAFNPLTTPQVVFEFDWSGQKDIPCERHSIKKCQSIGNGIGHAAFVWWDLQMSSEDNSLILSCAPYWAHPNNSISPQTSTTIPWRDHWMQAIYFLPTQITLQENKEFYLLSNHNEFLLWFDVNMTDQFSAAQYQEPICNTNFYCINSRTRIGQLNEGPRNKKYLRCLEDTVTPESVVLGISDGSLICLACSPLGAKQVYLLQENHYQRDVLETYIEFNQLKNIRILKNVDELLAIEDLITHVVAEPYFTESILPWDNFYFGVILRKIQTKLSPNVNILPKAAKIYAMPVEFTDLQKIRKPIRECEGFDIQLYDELLKKASSVADSFVEAQPLWEYPCKSLGTPVEILSVNFDDFEKTSKILDGVLVSNSVGVCNGVAVWVNWYLDGETPKSTVTTGPTIPCEPGEFVKWDMYTRQGVHLFFDEKNSTPGDEILWQTNFDYKMGNILFKFAFKK